MSRGLVFFDLDGTLLDSKDGIHAALVATAADLRLAPPDVERTRTSVGDGVENLLRRAFDGSVDLPRLHGVYDHHYQRTSVQHLRLYPGIAELLCTLDPARSAVVSNKPARHCRRILEALGIEGSFAHITGGDSFAEKKPSALPLLSLLHSMGGSAADSVLVGDGPQDIRAAKNAGMKSIAVLWGFCSAERLAPLNPDLLLADTAELAPALARFRA
jgi:phosphoglycolate phosphatase